MKKLLMICAAAAVLCIAVLPFLQGWALCTALEPESTVMYSITTNFGDTFDIVNGSFLAAEDYSIRSTDTPDEIICSFGKPPDRIESLFCSDEIRCYAADGTVFYKTTEDAEWKTAKLSDSGGKKRLDADPRIIPVLKEKFFSSPASFTEYIPYFLQEYPQETHALLKENMLADSRIFNTYFPLVLYESDEIKQAAAMLANGSSGELLDKYGFNKASDEDRAKMRAAAAEYFKYGGALSTCRDLLNTNTE